MRPSIRTYVLSVLAINSHLLNGFFYDYRKFQCIPKYLAVLEHVLRIVVDK